MRVDCDQYPYDTGSNPLRNLLPRWVQAGGMAAMLERLPRPEVRARLRADLARDGFNNFGRVPSWDSVRIAVPSRHPEDAGLTLGDVARRRGLDPLDAVCDYLVAEAGHTRILVTSMAEEDVDEITRAPWVLTCTTSYSSQCMKCSSPTVVEVSSWLDRWVTRPS